ncbi:hypothetical protein [Candidatus Chlamydia corallus]|uniref:hypothetical protein n=1 Tax=Candidatus Chlamydia corallus TaxID=2038470 RepID=UPI000C2FBF37|nr:hypothetical protein [Candidatus Chlamydia corallus]
MSTPTQPSPVNQNPSLIINKDYSLFSPLTPKERGESVAPIQCRWNHTIVKVSLVVLALLTIVAGALLLVLLPEIPLFIGISVIALGGVLLAIALLLSLCDCRVFAKKEIPSAPELKDIQIADLQSEMKEVLGQSLLEALLNGKEVGDPQVLELVHSCQERLAKFDRKLRCNEEMLYRLFAVNVKETEVVTKYELLIEMLEMRSRVADQLELNNRSYENFIAGTLRIRSEEEEKQLIAIETEISLSQQQLQDLNNQISDQRKRCASLLQRIRQSYREIQEAHTKELAECISESGEIDRATRVEIERALARQLRKMEDWNLMRSDIQKQEKLLHATKAKLEKLQDQLKLAHIAFANSSLFYREYKLKYLEQQLDLKNLLKELEAKRSEAAKLRRAVQSYEEQVVNDAADATAKKARWEGKLREQEEKEEKQAQEIRRLTTFLQEYREGAEEAKKVEQALKVLEQKYQRLQEEKAQKEKSLEDAVTSFANQYEKVQAENEHLCKTLQGLHATISPTMREEDDWVIAESSSEEAQKIKYLLKENERLMAALNAKNEEVARQVTELDANEHLLLELRGEIAKQQQALRDLDKLHEESVAAFQASQKKCQELEGLLSPVREDAGVRPFLEQQVEQLREENAQLRLEIERLKNLIEKDK